MTCTELAQQIEKFQPGASPQEVARLCLLLTTSVEDLAALREQRELRDAWKRTGLKLQVATDQHAAMTEELEALVLGARWVGAQPDDGLGHAASNALAKIATAAPEDLRDRINDTGLWPVAVWSAGSRPPMPILGC